MKNKIKEKYIQIEAVAIGPGANFGQRLHYTSKYEWSIKRRESSLEFFCKEEIEPHLESIELALECLNEPGYYYKMQLREVENV